MSGISEVITTEVIEARNTQTHRHTHTHSNTTIHKHTHTYTHTIVRKLDGLDTTRWLVARDGVT
jgi:hypothetical protein